MSLPATTTVPAAPRSPLERFLSLFTEVRAGEAPEAPAADRDVFLILTAYYVMKPAREAFILDQHGGAEIKSYALAARRCCSLAIVPLYGAVASRLPRRRLINLVTAFFIACLPVFYLVSDAGVRVGVPFFLWIGIFSLMVIAQFWAYANDIHTPEEGKRLFAVIAFGASSGAVFGAWLSGQLIRELGVRPLLLVAAGILAGSLALFNLVDLRLRSPVGGPAARTREDVPIGTDSAFALVLRSRYLLLVAATIFLLNWVNSAGEYILSAIVKQAADAEVRLRRAGGAGRRALHRGLLRRLLPGGEHRRDGAAALRGVARDQVPRACRWRSACCRWSRWAATRPPR